MTIRAFGALLCGVAVLLAAQTDRAHAEKTRRGGTPTTASGGYQAPAVPDIASLKVKGRNKQPNTGKRMGGGGGMGKATRVKKLDSSRSN